VCSHFELYREAMQSAGADVSPVAVFTEGLERGLPAAQALRKARAPRAAQAFVARRWRWWSAINRMCWRPSSRSARADDPGDVRAHRGGRAQSHPDELRLFHLYLRRHIEVDAAEHGPPLWRCSQGFAWRSCEVEGSDRSRHLITRFPPTVLGPHPGTRGDAMISRGQLKRRLDPVASPGLRTGTEASRSSHRGG